MRLSEETAAVREAYPDAYADVAILITEFGGVTGLLLLLSVLYWLGPRRETAVVVSFATAGLLLAIALKTLFTLPRPTASAALIEPADPYGFPSGHAFSATVVYGGLAYVHDLHRRWLAVVAVGAAVVVVSLSRIVLGVHYLGDLVAGVALGVAFLIAMTRATGGDPRRGFAIAIALSAPALAVVGPTEYVLTGLGGAIGGLAAAPWIDDESPSSWREGAVLVVVGLAFVVGLRSLGDAVATVELAAAVVAAALFAGILLLPAGVGRARSLTSGRSS